MAYHAGPALALEVKKREAQGIVYNRRPFYLVRKAFAKQVGHLDLWHDPKIVILPPKSHAQLAVVQPRQDELPSE